MRQILLVMCVMLVGCQRLRLGVDDLKLRCGNDAGVEDMDQWIEVVTDHGKPSPSSLQAVMINDRMETKKLPISSKGCVGKPKDWGDHQWLSMRVEEAGVFGKVMRLDQKTPWRLQLTRIPDGSQSIDCAKQETAGSSESKDIYQFQVKVPEDVDPENYHYSVKVLEKGGQAMNQGFALVPVERNAVQLNVQGLKEGHYQIELRIHDLASFKAGVKSISRTCPVAIDRTAPVVRLLGRGGTEPADRIIKAAPGEAIEFKVDDRNESRLFSCMMQTSRPGMSCHDYTESGRKITAPAEGEWVLSVYSIDAAGNKSSPEEYKITVFDSEKLRAIAGWLEEARLYTDQKDYLRSVFRIASALHGFGQLKAEAEKSSIRARLIAPLLQVLYKTVPYARFANDGVNVDAVFPMEGDRLAVVSGSIFHAGETEIKLMRTNGEVLKVMKIQERVSVFHNAVDHRLLVIYSGGSFIILDGSLNTVTEGMGSEFPVENFDRMPDRSRISARSFVYSHSNATYFLDLRHASVTKIVDGIAGVAVTSSGDWVSLRVDQDHYIYSHKARKVRPFKVGFDVKKTTLARRADTICYMGTKDLLCGSLPELFEGKIHLQNSLAGKAVGISADGQRIGYAGAEGVYFLDRKTGALEKKTFHGPVVQIFFDQDNTMMIDTIIGRKAWKDLYEGMDGSMTDQLPQLTRDQYWFGGTEIFVKKSAKAVEFFLPDAQGTIQKMTLEVDLNRVRDILQTRDRKFMVLVTDKEIEVISLKVQLGDGFKQPCHRISYDGEHCAWVGNGNLRIGRKVSDKGYLDYDMQDVPSSPEWKEIVWNDIQQQRFVVWNANEIGIGRMKAGQAIIEKRLPSGYFLTIRWLGGRYLAWVEDSLKIYDTVRHEYIGDFSDRSAETLFNPPVDYSPELSVMAAVMQNEEGELELKILQPSDGSEIGSWKFTDKGGSEEADLVRFSDDGLSLLLGFHDGSVQVLDSDRIQKKIYEPRVIAQHADSVMGGDFMKAPRTAYTISMDGALVIHSDTGKDAPVFQGTATYPMDDSILYTGVVKSENLIWVSDQGSLQIFDPARRHFDEVLGGKAYFRNQWLMAWRNPDESYRIDIVKLDYLSILCGWLKPSIRFGIFKNEERSSICNQER